MADVPKQKQVSENPSQDRAIEMAKQAKAQKDEEEKQKKQLKEQKLQEEKLREQKLKGQAQQSQQSQQQQPTDTGQTPSSIAAFLQAIFYPSSFERWNIQNLDYGVYTAISVLFGWSGADLLYLGSPFGAVLKAFVNLFTFGYWWFYDAILAIGSAPQVKLFGTSIPMIGPSGIGACRFNDKNSPPHDPEAKKKHMTFLLYGIGLICLGWLGIDQLIAGEPFNCFMHIAAFITVIGIPLAFVAYAIRSFMFIFDTNRVIDQNWQLFGARKPKDKGAECQNLPAQLASTGMGMAVAVGESSPLGLLFAPVRMVMTSFNSFMEIVGTSSNLFVEALRSVGVIARSSTTLRVPLTEEINKAGRTMGGGEEVPFTEEINKAAEIITGVNTEPPTWVPMTAGLLALTLGFIVVSSIVLYFRRSVQNGSKQTKTAATIATTSTPLQQPDQDDDVPPEPRVSRVPQPA